MLLVIFSLNISTRINNISLFLYNFIIFGLFEIFVLFFKADGFIIAVLNFALFLWFDFFFGDFDIWYSPATFRHNFSFPVKAAYLHRKNLWRRVLEANKKLFSGNKNRYCQSNLEEQRKRYVNP